MIIDVITCNNRGQVSTLKGSLSERLLKKALFNRNPTFPVFKNKGTLGKMQNKEIQCLAY